MMKPKYVPRVVAATALLMLIGGFAISQHRGPVYRDFGPAKVAYDDYIRRPSLQMRTRGRLAIAQTGHRGAYEILTESYGRPEDPKEQVKSLIASIVADYFSGSEWTDRNTEWRNKHKQAEDAWMWYRTLVLHHRNSDEEELFRIANEERELFLRAAALEALAQGGSDQLLEWWHKELDKAENWRGIERAVMLEAAAHAFSVERFAHGEDIYRRVGLKLIPFIDHKDTHERTQLVLARYFRDAFNSDKLYINQQPWLRMLLNPDNPERASEGYATAPPTRFVGVEASGRRIVYVIDLSDSMMIPLTRDEREEMRRPPEPSGPITGEGGSRREGEVEKEKEEEEDFAAALPWDRINTRFDAAREFLKLSLQDLQPDQYYCVIMFGTNAEFARSTRTLVQATPRNIQNTIRELDRIRPSAATRVRTHGVLMGDTNLHGGMHRAFMVKTDGVVNGWSNIDHSTFFSGADTIFLLSDGDPTDDDWAMRDRRDDFDRTGDPETGTRFEDQDYLRFPGPYGYMYDRTYLPDDMKRLNLFRKTEMHIIGIGEVTEHLLHAIGQASAGRGGQVRFIGGN
jgi:hypothetical protein